MTTANLADLLSDITHFSQYVLSIPLYTYQLTPIQAILDSILNLHGREFILVFPRQSGKNEAVAHLLVYLLNLFQRRGGSIVYGAIGDGLGRGIRRLDQRLDNPLNIHRWRKSAKPASRWLGRASVIFLSTHPYTASRGETATWLLVIDEMQDQDHNHLESVFEPMRAANNATAVYIGTVRTTSDALWRKKLELEQLQAKDSIQRVFVVDPEVITQENLAYSRFLQAKILRYGRNHPIVACEYFNEPIYGAGGLFDKRRRQLMKGTHPREEHPNPSDTYLATLDVAGQDEAATDALADLDNPGRDYTVCTIFRLTISEDIGPIYQAVDVFVDHGSRHFEDFPGRPMLARRLLAWLNHWNASHIVADESGVGAGLVSWLSGKLGADRVTGYTFTAINKAKLGSAFISLIETGRYKYWTGDEDEELSDGWWFWQQVEACGYHIPPGGQFDKSLSWSVATTARISTPTVRQKIHDDRLISGALVAIYDQLIADGSIRVGQARSAIIEAYDPLKHLRF